MGEILLVTGGGRGIGRATVELAAAKGFDVAIGYRDRRDEADAALAAVEAAGQRAIAVQADVGSEPDIIGMFEETEAKLGKITALVNCAGMTTRIRVDTMDVNTLQRLM
ncbi:MAG: SDR family NAD(P)-dependent oxidoreductase, partial [Geminicoccaceae bacterium]